MSNIQLATSVLKSCWCLGVRDIVLCAGARNAPFVSLLSGASPFSVHPFFEERSGAFFALGKILSSGRPVAVITTSGTAAAELLPAAIEADYQGLPLVLVTADRPRRYRGSGAPQTINQIGIYSHYVEASYDIEEKWNGDLPPRLKRPIHLNVCFDEPLIDAAVGPLTFSEDPPPTQVFKVETRETVILKNRRPLVIVGQIPSMERELVVKTLVTWGRPVYLESPSGLHGRRELAELVVRGGEKSLGAMSFDGVIRIGSVPTLRLWRDLEAADLPVAHFSHLPYSGLPRERMVYPLASLRDLKTDFAAWSDDERQADRQRAESNEQLLNRLYLSEPGWVRWLSRQIPPRARVFVGNSLPIREWDLAATREPEREIFANRGANGIDGLISTFLGIATADRPNWCVIGDLSALYDLSGPWPARGGELKDLNLVIINNGGGKIFHRLFHNPLFENNHKLNFKAWAEMWGWEYQLLNEPRDLPPASRPRVIEIVPSDGATEEFWKSIEEQT